MKHTMLFIFLNIQLGVFYSHASTAPDWAEGSCNEAGHSGATDEFFNRGARLKWKNYLGDWIDSEGQAQGNHPFATFAIDNSDETQTLEANITSLVSLWHQNTLPNTGFLLRNLEGGSAHIFTKESQLAESAPTLTLITSVNDYSIQVEADTYLNSSTYKCMGEEPVMKTSDHILLYFDLSKVDSDEVILSATLHLTTTDNQYGDEATIGIFAAAPSYTQYQLQDRGPGIASEYPNDYAIDTDARVLFSEHFEREEWESNWSVSSDKDHLELVGTDDHDNHYMPLLGKSVKASLPEGKLTAMNVSYLFQEELGYEPESLYFRYYLRFGNNWKTVDGGKLPGLAGTYEGTSYRGGWGGRRSNGTNGWSARGIFRKVIEGNNPFSQRVPIGNYLYHADMQEPYGDLIVWNGTGNALLETNRWYAIEQHVRLNTPGLNDGVLETWIDGEPAYQQTGLKFRNAKHGHIKIDRLWMNIYHGGTQPNDKDVEAFVDNIVIATEYIGPTTFDSESPAPGPSDNQAPEIISRWPSTTTVNLALGDQVEFDVASEDPEGDELTFAWSLNGEHIAVDEDDEGFVFFPSYAELGTHQVDLIISDEHEATTVVSWQVNVSLHNAEIVTATQDTHLSPSTSKALGTQPYLAADNTVYMRFAGLPPKLSKHLTSAYLVLFDHKQYGDINLSVYASDNSWQQGKNNREGATRQYREASRNDEWVNEMGDWFDVKGELNGSHAFQTVSLHDTDTPRFVGMDVTSLVARQAKDSQINLALKVSEGQHKFVSTEHEDAHKHPALLITTKGFELQDGFNFWPNRNEPEDDDRDDDDRDDDDRDDDDKDEDNAPPVDGKSLAHVASELAPGQWAKLRSKNFSKDLVRVNFNGKTLHISGWTDDAMWHSETQTVSFMGFRKIPKMIQYRASQNSWEAVKETFKWPKKKRNGHVYGNNAMNPDNGDFYHYATGTDYIYKRAAAGGDWEQMPAFPFKRDGLATAIEYFPEMNGVLRIQRNQMHVLKMDPLQWHDLGELPDLGYHSLMRYNPHHNEVLIAGGNADRKKVVSIDGAGNILDLPDAPAKLSIKHDKLLVHPGTGDYIFIKPKHAWILDRKTLQYTKIEGYTPPFKRAYLPFTVSIPDYDVIMFVADEVFLYKPPLSGN